MDLTVRVCGLIGREGRSRVNVVKLALGSYPQNGTLVVDFQGVDFVSRSFADEVVSQVEGRQYKIVNANAVVANMFKAVVDGRSKPRTHAAAGNVEIVTFDSMVELSRYLNTAL